jgi:hypothetical protein
VAINYSHNPAYKFIFIRGDYSDFCRMMSNLINNSVEAMEDQAGVVDIDFSVDGDEVKIRVKDTGNGMPREMAEALMNGVSVGTTKQHGHGIGMRQITQTLEAMNAKMSIESGENEGTTFILTIPQCEPPQWFVDKILVRQGDTIVALDDNPSIFEVWKARFQDHLNDVALECFTEGVEAINFVNSFKEKDKILLLADYELRNQSLNGIDVIEKCGLRNQSIIVTSAHLHRIKEFNEKAHFMKLFPKAYINDIPIVLHKVAR